MLTAVVDILKINQIDNSIWVPVTIIIVGWGFSSVVECLPSKHKALGSVPSSGEKKKNNHNWIQKAKPCERYRIVEEHISQRPGVGGRASSFSCAMAMDSKRCSSLSKQLLSVECRL